jgi:hypothetical protein
MRTILSICAALAAMTLLVGCGGNSYVGKWKAAASSDDPKAQAMIAQLGDPGSMELKEDGTAVMETMGQTAEGTYKVEDNKVSVTLKDQTTPVVELTPSADGDSLVANKEGVTLTFTRIKE